MGRLWREFNSDRLQTGDFAGNSIGGDSNSKSIQETGFFPVIKDITVNFRISGKNLLTANQATGTDDLDTTTDFVSYCSSGLSSSTDHAVTGTKSLKCYYDGGYATCSGYFAGAIAWTSGYSVNGIHYSGETYSFSVWVWSPTGVDVEVGWRLWSVADGNEENSHVVNITGDDTWQKATFSLTLTKNYQQLGLEFINAYVGRDASDYFYVDCLQIEAGSSITDWENPNATLKDLQGKHTIALEQNLQGKYSVLLQQNLQGKYTVIFDATTKDLQGKNSVLLQQNIQGKYTIPIQQNLQGKYLILLQQNIQGKYIVILQQNLQGKYTVVLQQSIQGKYIVILQQNLQGKYTVVLQQNLQGKYTIEAAALTKDLQGKYTIAIQQNLQGKTSLILQQNLQGKYSILTFTGIIVNCQYIVRRQKFPINTILLRYISWVKKGPNAKILQYIEKTVHLHTPSITLGYELYNPSTGRTVYGDRFNRMMFNRPRRETGTHTYTFHYNTQYYVRVIPSPQTHGLTYLIKNVYTNGIDLAYGIKYLAATSGFTDLLKYYVKKVHTQGYELTYIPKHTPTPLYNTLAYYVKKVHDIYENLQYILKRTPAAQTYNLTYTIKRTPAAQTYGLDYDVRLVRPYPLMLLQYYTKSIQKYSPLYPQIGVRLAYFLPNFDILILTRDLRYILKIVKSQQYTLAYWVKTIHTSSTIGATYYVRQIKSKVADIRYIIKTIPVAKTYPLTYYVHRRTTNTSIGLTYLLPTGFSQYIKRYLARYIIIIHLIKQRDLRYVIKRTPASSTKGLTYYVRKSHIKSPAPTSQYYILKKHLISPLLRYIIPQLKKKVYEILTYFVKSKKKVTPLPGLQYLIKYSRKYRYPPGIPLRYMILGETVFSEVCTHLNCPLPTPKMEYLTCGLTTNKSVSITCPLQVPKSVTVTCRFVCGV